MKKSILINESTLKRIVSETLKRMIREDIDDLEDGYEEDEIDDWRSEEPSQDSVQSIMTNISQKCIQNGITFKNLGDNEFGVISGNKSCPEIALFLQSMEKDGTIHKTGGGILPNSVLRVKYRIIKG